MPEIAAPVFSTNRRQRNHYRNNPNTATPFVAPT